MDEEAKIADAKRLAAGPWGEKMGKFPLLFATTAVFGQRPSRDQPSEINSGSITLVDLGNGPIALTCQHVIAGYRERLAKFGDVMFQIGNVEFNPLDQLIDENKRLDLATIGLSEQQRHGVTLGGEIGSCIFKPVDWPPPLPTKGEFIAFGGFPGALRSVRSFDELDFPSWSSGAEEISSVSDFQFACAFDRSYWIKSFGENAMDLRVLGGMSGGPALIKRRLHWDLVGIVSQYHENYDAMFYASLRPVRLDGSIEPPPV